MKISIRKSYTFEYAHTIFNQQCTKFNPETRCKSIHGHSGKVDIEISNSNFGEHIKTESGMVVDFNNLKPIKDYFDLLDHSMIISSMDKKTIEKFGLERYVNVNFDFSVGAIQLADPTERLWVLFHQPATSENLAIAFGYRIQGCLWKIEKELNDGKLFLEKLTFSEKENNSVIINYREE